MTDSPSGFVWYELMTSDMAAAEAFYRVVVGWGAEDSGQPNMRYTMLTAGGQPVAGLMTVPAEAAAAGAKPGWMGYIGVGDLDAAAADVKDAGGTVHRDPADIPGIGRFAVAADPQGAGFTLFQPSAGAQRTAPAMTPGHVGWHELHTSDWEGAIAFYAARFGWTRAEAMDMGPMGTYQIFACGAEAVGGMMNSPNFPRPAWLFYFIVDAIDAAIARVAAGGGRVLQGPHEVPGGSWVVQAQDPQGALFALVASQR